MCTENEEKAMQEYMYKVILFVLTLRERNSFQIIIIRRIIGYAW